MGKKLEMSEAIQKAIFEKAKEFIETKPGDISYPGRKNNKSNAPKKDS